MRAPQALPLTFLLLTSLLHAQSAPAVLPPPTPLEGDLVLTEATCRAPFRDDGTHECGLGDTVLVKFTNLREWIAADPVKHDPANLTLALNNHALPGTHSNVLIANSNLLTFDLVAPEGSNADSEANKQAWREILRGHHSPTSMSLSVGLRNGQTFYGPVKMTFHLYPRFAFLVFIGIALLLLTVVWLASKSGLIRSPGPRPAIGLRPYSLGRAQMAWWFVLVVASYLYIWLLTENRDSLTTGVLILTGISAATGLSSKIVGSGKPAAPDADTPAPAPPTAVASYSGTAAAVAPALAPAPPATPAAIEVSKGFLTDILNDENGVSFDRLQMAGWTIVLGIVFIAEVVNDLNMPDFSPTLLGLMGISSGTYIGFKLPGKNG